jgi:FLYWCH zinc finger domain
MKTSAAKAAVYIPAKMGGQKLKDPDGYIYDKSKTVKDRVYWNCRERRQYNLCTSTAVTQRSTGAILKVAEHNHDNRLLENITRALEQEKIEAAASDPSILTSTIIRKCFKGIVSRDFGTLFLISLDRFEGPYRAG